MFDSVFWLKDGGLASYGPSFIASGRQAARLVDKIIKGANPGEIPWRSINISNLRSI